ncbi:MAG: hypothetical protein Q8N22_02400 [bacterium]|nr:hypothetical protein [bacterium]
MLKNLRKILQNIQAADETKKKHWLFILSAIAMILIISFWAIYFNKTIINSDQAAATEPADNQSSAQTPKESSWQVFITGFKTIVGQIKELITAARKISVETDNPNFTTSSPGILNATSTQ